jgi:IS4 transposase
MHWKIELFFKEIKQNLCIKSFVGNSRNTVFIQSYTALTVYLLLAYQEILQQPQTIRAATSSDHPTQPTWHDFLGRFSESTTTKK